MSSSRGLHIIGLMQALVSLSDSILVSLLLYLKLEHFIIYIFLLLLKNSCNNYLFGPCIIRLYSCRRCTQFVHMYPCCSSMCLINCIKISNHTLALATQYMENRGDFKFR
jgi:hypothetical protein